MKKLKWILIPLVLLLGIALVYFWKDTQNPYASKAFNIKSCDLTVDEHKIPKFNAIPFDFKHQFDKNTSLPVLGSCIVDVDNDGVDEVFIGGGRGQSDGLFKYMNRSFKDISTQLPTKSGNTLGAISYDFDQDGLQDIIVARDDGVYLLMNREGVFSQTKLDIPLNAKSSPVSLTLGDINNDGAIDMFVAGSIKKELMEGQTIFNDNTYGGSSLLLLNNGDNSFTDVTAQYNLSYIHNTFQGVFVDLNKDGFLDLAVAYDTGEPRIYMNQAGKKFVMKNNPHTGKFSYPMGIAVGDYDNNQSPDLFFSNTGSSVPKMMAKGDLTKDQELFTDWILLNNDGTGSFTEKGKETNIADFEFSWGAIFEDFNLDGQQDLVVAENYIAFPPQALFKLPCRFLVQLDNGVFAAVEKQANVVNKKYAITPLSSDFNNDGYPDLIYTNLDGKVAAYINKGGEANYFKVRLKDTPQNIGAVVTVTTSSRTQSNYNVIGEGLCSDQSNELIFGLHNDDVINAVTVTKVGGKVIEVTDAKINTSVFID